MPNITKRLILGNELEQINLLAEYIETIAEEANIDPSMTMSINLALEEAVTNVILYAYPEGKKGEIIIDAHVSDHELTFIIMDKGVAFDPTQKEDADITLGVEERPIGGLGIFLVKQLMDHVNYKRIEESNILTMSKSISHG